MAAWLTNFCRGFSNHLDTFSLEMESLQKREEVLKRRRKMKKKRWVQGKANAFVLCHGRPGITL